VQRARGACSARGGRGKRVGMLVFLHRRKGTVTRLEGGTRLKCEQITTMGGNHSSEDSVFPLQAI